jgi:hypothetical protein
MEKFGCLLRRKRRQFGNELCFYSFFGDLLPIFGGVLELSKEERGLDKALEGIPAAGRPGEIPRSRLQVKQDKLPKNRLPSLLSTDLTLVVV